MKTKKRIIDLPENQSKLTDELVTESYNPGENETLIKKYFSPDVKTVLSKGALYCTLVHFLIFERFVKSKIKYAIIFENDVCFPGSFNDKIPLIIQEAEHLNEGFIISLENSTLRFPSWRKTKRWQNLYEADLKRCAGGYRIDQKTAQSMLDELQHNPL